MRRSRIEGALAVALCAVPAAALLAVVSHDADAAASATVELRATPPAAVALPAGAVLAWHNADSIRHRIRSADAGEEFDSGDLDPGETYTHAFSRPGTFAYVDRRKETEAGWLGFVAVGVAPAPPAPPPSPGPAPPPVATPVIVDVTDYAFTPGTVTVVSGARITFRNTGRTAHTVTARDGSFDVTLAPGASTVVTPARAGTFAYYCRFHRTMVGSVTVVGAPEVGPAPPASRPGTAPKPVVGTSKTRTGGVRATIRDFRFEPVVVRVRAGQSVTWTNRGATPHSVTALNGSFDSHVLAAHASWTHVFRSKGVYRLVCSLHPHMRARVVVQPAGRVKRRPPARRTRRSGSRSRAAS